MTELQTPARGDTPEAALPMASGADVPAITFPSMDLHFLVATKYQPRTIFEPVALQELAESIKVLGVMQPILVRRLPASRIEETHADRRKGDALPTHEIVAGERRYRAAKLAGLKAIIYLERDLTDAQVAHMALAENVQREDLHKLEEAKAYRNILELEENAEKPMADRIAALAREIKKSTRYVYQTLQLLKLCDFAQQVFLERTPTGEPKLLSSIALQIATIGNEAQQIEATRHCAGLSRQGTEVVQHPLSHRAAAEYIDNNFRLVLKKAAFPIKVEFAGVGACNSCPKMSANARELFPEGATVPDTCMDPSCYGKKNTAHYAQVAEAAKKSGQRVISGGEAKKILPYEDSPESLIHAGDYYAVTEHLYEGNCGGKTVKQLLGADMPKPILIQRPDGKGFVEALPKKQVRELLDKKGLLGKVRHTNPNAEVEKKAKAIKAYRQALAEKLMAAVEAWETPIVKTADASDSNALLSKLQLLMGIRIYGALDNEGSKKLCRLMGWEVMGRWGDRKTLRAKLEVMDGVAFNRYVVSALIADELSVPTWNSNPQCPNMDDLAAIFRVDAKQVKDDLAKATKDAENAKAKKKAPPVKRAIAKAPAKHAGAPKPAAPATKKAEALTSLQLKTPITRWMHTTEADRLRQKAGLQVRVVNEEDNLSLQLVKHAGKVGILQSPVGPKAWMVDLPHNDGTKSFTSTSFHFDELMLFTGEVTELTVGMPVRFKPGLKGATHNRKCSGRKGVIEEITKQGGCMVRCDGYKELYRAEPEELEIFEGDKAPEPTAAAAAAPKKAAAPARGPKPIKAKPAVKKEEQLALGGLDQPKTTLQPQQGWPFPTSASEKGGAQ